MPPEHPSVTYLPGRWTALAANDVWLLADLDPSSPILAACWETVERGGGVDGLLGVILREGLRSVPSFALVGRSADGLRLLVSGKAQAEATRTGSTEPTVISAAEAPTWIEQRLDGQPDIRLRGDDAGAPQQGITLPLAGGVVLASEVLVGGVASFSEQRAPVPGNLTAEFDAELEGAAPPQVPAAILTPAPTLQAPVDEPPVPEPVAAEPAPEAAEPVPAAAEPVVATATADPAGDEVADPPRSFDHLFGKTGNPLEGLPDPASAAASNDTMQPKPQDLHDGPPPGGVIDALPWLLPGALGSPAEAPAPSAPPSAPVPPSAPAPPAVPVPPPSAPVPPPAAPALPPAPAPPAAPVAAPLAAPAPDPFAPPVAFAPPPVPAPHGPPAQQQPHPEPIAGPIVHAVQCQNQHLNPPYATSCRVCGQPIQQQEPFPAQRPTLGILNMSTGDMVPLDRDVVLGRAPFHADKNAQSRPHLVQLASPGNDISRSHVRVGIEGWHVQVTDLGSTNGTVVTMPGQAPVRLRAHDPFTIVPGTTITIADEVNVRYEVST